MTKPPRKSITRTFYDHSNDPWFTKQFNESTGGDDTRCYLNGQGCLTEKHTPCSLKESKERTKRKKMEMSLDPLDPSTFKQKRVPKPVPVVYLPPKEPVAVKKKQDWNIPPCESIWEGCSIQLADRFSPNLYARRGQDDDIVINYNFAKLSETLYLASERATEAMSMRGEMRKEQEFKDLEDSRRA